MVQTRSSSRKTRASATSNSGPSQNPAQTTASRLGPRRSSKPNKLAKRKPAAGGKCFPDKRHFLTTPDQVVRWRRFQRHPLVLRFHETIARCKRCLYPVKLSDRSPYDKRHWLCHVINCLGRPDDDVEEEKQHRLRSLRGELKRWLDQQTNWDITMAWVPDFREQLIREARRGLKNRSFDWSTSAGTVNDENAGEEFAMEVDPDVAVDYQGQEPEEDEHVFALSVEIYESPATPDGQNSEVEASTSPLDPSRLTPFSQPSQPAISVQMQNGDLDNSSLNGNPSPEELAVAYQLAAWRGSAKALPSIEPSDSEAKPAEEVFHCRGHGPPFKASTGPATTRSPSSATCAHPHAEDHYFARLSPVNWDEVVIAPRTLRSEYIPSEERSRSTGVEEEELHEYPSNDVLAIHSKRIASLEQPTWTIYETPTSPAGQSWR
ncbi:hypothetical protein C8T65DRAFT_832359 [Cerioporus squamosus]|nr:hypothetical protein C8T65DRAFT_832359 [Cerioporus squamosus]